MKPTLLTAAIGVLSCLGPGGLAASDGPVFSLQPVRAAGAAPTLAGVDRPLSLAAADLDGDGVAEVIAGYARGSAGFVVVHQGNVAALFSPPRLAGEPGPAPFVGLPVLVDVPVLPSFLVADDFDADGRADVVVAAAGGRALYLMKGNGSGSLEAAGAAAVPGAVSAMVAGDVNRRDGLSDLLVGIADGQGPGLAVFEGPQGAFAATAEVHALPAAPAAIAFGRLDADATIDVAVGAGSKVWIVHGRDRQLSLDTERRAAVAPAVVDGIAFDASVVGIAVADFLPVHDAYDEELAVLDGRGTLHLLERGLGWQPAATRAVGDAGVSGTLLRAPVSGAGVDLIVLDTTRQRLTLFSPARTAAASTADLRLARVIEGAGTAVAALPLRINGDALADLVLLGADGDLSWVETSVVSIFTVTNVANSGAGSLRAAIAGSNSNAGPDLIQFDIVGAGPHILLPLANYEALNEPVTIDGYTQPGSAVSSNAAPGPINAVIKIEIDASTSTEFGAGFIVLGGSSVIRGLSVIDWSFDGIVLSSANNIIEGNFIGVAANGLTNESNERYGVGIDTSAGNTIGGTAAGSRNIVSGNLNDGVRFVGPGCVNNLVRGNYLGADATGLNDAPNDSDGVEFVDGTGNTVGGLLPGSVNVISGNADDGVVLSGGSNLVQGNIIGLGYDGVTPVNNAGSGVDIDDSNHTIGGTAAGAGNLISSNGNGGVLYEGTGSATLIQGNLIGTDTTGTLARGNFQAGVILRGAGHTVGGAVPGARNLISGNTGQGVLVSLSTSGGNAVQGNFIGTDVTGSADLGNTLDGIGVLNAPNTQIGSASDPDGLNVISGNNDDGIHIQGTTATGTLVAGNFIGTDVSGNADLGNGFEGVFVLDSPGGTIGGPGAFGPNLIYGNDGHGVAVTGNSSVNNRISSNAISGNSLLGIDLAYDGVTPNDAGDADSGPNMRQNFPSITSAELSTARTLDVRGNIASTASTTFRVELFVEETCDPSGAGEGYAFMAAKTVVTGAGGSMNFSELFTDLLFVPKFITATAIDPSGNTSEFSTCRAATCPVVQVFGQTVRLSDTAVTWNTSTYVQWVKGILSQVGTYATTGGGTLLPGSSFSHTEDVPAGPYQGFYYVVKPFMCGSWQTTVGAQPGRDANLP